MGGVSVRATGLSWHRSRALRRPSRAWTAGDTNVFLYYSSPPVVPECSELKLVAKKLAQRIYITSKHTNIVLTA
jgi:hypothetical protein